MRAYSDWARDITEHVGIKGAEKLIKELERIIRSEESVKPR